MRVEHEYFREGAWTYLAAWDVHRAKLFGRCEKKSGIAPTDRLMAEVMTQEPYRSAHPAALCDVVSSLAYLPQRRVVVFSCRK